MNSEIETLLNYYFNQFARFIFTILWGFGVLGFWGFHLVAKIIRELKSHMIPYDFSYHMKTPLHSYFSKSKIS